MSEAKIKGVATLNFIGYLRQTHGEAGLEKFLKALPPERAAWMRSAFAHEWYPHRHHVEALKTFAEVFHGGDYTKTSLLGVHNLQQSITGIYRVLVRLLSPETLIAKSARLWGTFMSEGRLETERLGERSLRVRVVDLDPVHRAWCESLNGAFAGSVQACGEPGARCTHVACVLDRAPCCEYALTW